MLFRASPIFSPKANRVRFKTEGSGKNGRVQNRAEKRAGPVCGKAIAFHRLCLPVQTEQDALDFITSKKSEHWDASHNVYAYILRDGTMRFSDDGEPQGTAGMPVLDVLRKSGVTDVVTVATRYFGGILLGGGGLVRAYSHTASIALQAAQIITMRECLLLSLTCDYGRYGRVASLVPECGGVTDDTVFEEKVTVKFHLAPELLGAFRKKLADATNGQVDVTEDGKKFFEFEE